MILDSPDENWASMDLVGEMLVDQWQAMPSEVRTTLLSIPIPRVVPRFARAHRNRGTLNAERALVRYGAYPLRAFTLRRPQRLFHVVDHSYAHLVHVLPSSRTGVYCHDTDAFQAFLKPALAARGCDGRLLRTIAWALLRGLQAAAVVFYSTHAIGRVLEGLVGRSRLVHAPYGISPEFSAEPNVHDDADERLSSLRGHPFVLHVGSAARRKRLDVLFEVFARLHARHPQLRLVQQGAIFSSEHHAQVAKLGIADALLQPPKLDRRTLAGLYRQAAVVVLTSEAEGFGIPVIEAMACGAQVVASDIPVLREVGSDAALYAPLADVEAWTELLDGILRGQVAVPAKSRRLARARNFTWECHARTILDTYRNIAEFGKPNVEASSADTASSLRQTPGARVAFPWS